MVCGVCVCGGVCVGVCVGGVGVCGGLWVCVCTTLYMPSITFELIEKFS